MALRSSHRDQ